MAMRNSVPVVRQLQHTCQTFRTICSSSVSASGWFGNVEQAPKDPILGVTEAYLADENPEKINLGVGAYRNDLSKPVVLNVVRAAEEKVSGKLFMEYLPIGGLKSFTEKSIKLAYGDNASCIQDARVAAVQSLSGTGSCRLFAEFMHRYLPGAAVYIPKPTWANHHNIFRDAQVEQRGFRYYKPDTRGLDFEGLMEDLQGAEEGSVVLLHACAHNPTGVDPTAEQWQELSKLMLKKHLYPFFDMAYQGFATGDCDRDSQAIRTFLDDGHSLGCSQSYAKNMGLYGQRIGCLSLVCADKAEASAVESQVKAIARAMYSNPPVHGALLVDNILGTPEIKQQWFDEVKGMADRIIDMRTLLQTNLEKSGSSLPWKHVTEQIGMFCFSGISPEQVDLLAKEHSIYMTRNGRISMAGVTSKNVDRLAAALHKVTS